MQKKYVLTLSQENISLSELEAVRLLKLKEYIKIGNLIITKNG
ncbi:MAG: hypothetical protein KatS3mg002_1618 [Candidatus Woesearchaeota archaeon]|nr:MAG: hypothetical protein KatS3mg002_1618 [Candidatus Woesearchaeota archaeon]